ncbi:MAG: hypothetical protein BGO96_01805 [Micrococcales bacterium 73-15]|uniref:DUF4349 domain-containing protein n=1 Tax=Salana multivorans TaxID=120377 RepID=UPI000961BCDE|nr:DUF4349 domain-containing protein [Salana multivorans]OJX94809.1 MAG: hypothetical protein BGO96_01805 [Micrococcales bacterium 73-15]
MSLTTTVPARTSAGAAPARGRPRRRILVGLSLAVSAALVGACSSGGTDSGGAAYDSAADGGEYYAPEAGDMPVDPGLPGGVSGAERSVIQTGYVYATSDDPVAAATKLVGIIDAVGGRIESQQIVTASEYRHPSADLTTRIPSDHLTEILAQVGDAVDVVESQLTSEDVTAQVVDLDARITAKELSIERLEELLAGATTTADIISAEETLTQRQTELEQLLTMRKGYSDAVEMATITLHVSMPDQIPVSPPPGFTGGVASGWTSLVATVTGVLVVVGFIIPWLLVVAVIGGAWILGRRWLRARRPATPVTITTVASPAPASPSTPAEPSARVSEPTAPAATPPRGSELPTPARLSDPVAPAGTTAAATAAPSAPASEASLTPADESAHPEASPEPSPTERAPEPPASTRD